jgi:hypothetical protein
MFCPRPSGAHREGRRKSGVEAAASKRRDVYVQQEREERKDATTER